MTPKEKAKELVERFFEVQIQDINALPRAKQCALICVDEIIQSLSCQRKPELHTFIIGLDFVDGNGAIYYWQQVKQEINLL